MKTDDLIALLATAAGPAPRAVAARRLAPIALLGSLVAALGALVTIGPIPQVMFSGDALWLKLAYTGSLALAAAWLSARLSRPASATAVPWIVLMVVATVFAVLGAVALAQMPGGQRLSAVLGTSWTLCPWAVLALSLPSLAGSLWALRGLAPVRPRLAGLAAGLLAGALGALGYSLACIEESMAFVAAWYTLGIVLTGALGAALGPRVLRW